MATKSTILTFENYVKFTGMVVINVITVTGLYYAQKSDIRNLNTVTQKDKEMIEYKIMELQNCCNDRRNEKRIVFSQQPALAPNEVEFKTEN